MQEYDALLSDPKFKEYLQKQGFALRETKNYKGKIILADKKERSLNWGFATESFLRTMMLANNIEKIDPWGDMIHFSIIVYSMLIEDMVTDGQVNERYLTFDEMQKLLPTEVGDLHALVDVMNSVFSKNRREFIAM